MTVGVADAAGAGGPESQALEIKPVSARLSLGDLMVFVGAVALVLLGWGVKTWHDNRMVETEVAGVVVAYPLGWFVVPVEAPEVLRAISDQDARTTLRLTAQPTSAEDVVGVLMMAPGVGSMTAGQTAYTQLGNEEVSLDGVPALRSDYAFVDSQVGGVAAPRVIRGRQIAWIAAGQLYVLALEAPTEHWSEASRVFDRILDRVETGGGN